MQKAFIAFLMVLLRKSINFLMNNQSIIRKTDDKHDNSKTSFFVDYENVKNLQILQLFSVNFSFVLAQKGNADYKMQKRQKERHSPALDESSSSICFDFMQKVGSNGKYQLVALCIWCGVAYLSGGVTLISSFLLYQDPYTCPANHPHQNCQPYVCALDPSERVQYLPTNAMNTLIDQYGDYRCDPDLLTLDLIEIGIFSAIIIGYLLIVLLSGRLGRKTLLACFFVSTIIGLLIVVLSVNLGMAAFGLFLALLGSKSAQVITYSYLSQIVIQSRRAEFSTKIQFCQSLAIIINVGGFYFLKVWRICLIFLYLTPAIVILLAMIVYLVEPPLVLLTQQTIQDAIRGFKKMANMNEIQNPMITVYEIEEARAILCGKQKKETIQDSDQHINVCSLWKYKSLRNITIPLIFLAASSQFYGPQQILDQFQQDLFLNDLVLGIASLIGVTICFFLLDRMKRKLISYICFVSILVCSYIFIFAWHPDPQSSHSFTANIGILFAVFLFRFFGTLEFTFFEIYLIQLYPTQVRMIGIGFVGAVGALIITSFPLLIDHMNEVGFPVMIIFAIVAGISIAATWFLPQTLNTTPQDLISQLAQTKKENVVAQIPPTERFLSTITNEIADGQPLS